MAAHSTAQETLSIDADRWRLRDVASCVQASLMHSVPLDTQQGATIAHGVAPMAAGVVHAAVSCAQHDHDDPVAAAAAHRSRREIRVRYGPESARIGGRIALDTHVEDDVVQTTVYTEAGVIAEIAQRTSPDAVTNATDRHGEPPATTLGATVEDFTRVRVARWAYVSGELCPAHGDHVAATGAGLPAAIVPSTLLLAIAEHRLFPEGPCEGVELVLELLGSVFAGEQVSVSLDERAATVTFAAERGLLARAHIIGPRAPASATTQGDVAR